jgi:Tol biopolymer transport system component
MVEYRWTVTGGEIIGADDGQQITIAPTIDSGTIVIGLTVVDENGCESSCDTTMEVLCAPEPVAPDIRICVGEYEIGDIEGLLIEAGAGCIDDCGETPAFALSEVNVDAVGAYSYTVSCGDLEVCGSAAQGTVFVDGCSGRREPEVSVSSGGEVCAGWWNSFTLRVNNTGDLPLTEVVIENMLGGVGFDIRSFAPASYGSGKLTWTISRIDPGQEVVLTFEVRPYGGTAGSWMQQTVTVTSREGAEDEMLGEFLVLDCDPAPTPTPTPFPGGPCPVCPDWVVFQSDRHDRGDYDIYRMGFDGEDVVRLTTHEADDIQPTWSFDGSQIAFASYRDGDWEIYRMNADGSGQTNVTNWPLAEDGISPSQDMAPSWSCDWIAFQTDRHGQWEIYKTDPNGAQQIRLTDNDAADEQPVWSPDGQWIAFQSDRDGQWEIYVMDAQGFQQRRITNDSAADRHPTWSWDGQWIAFTSDRDGQDDIYKVHVQTGEVVRLTDHLAADAHAAWMPYCEYIFFQSDRDEDYEVYRMGYEGEDQTNISREPEWIDGLDLAPGFGPDALFNRIVTAGAEVSYDLLANDIGGRASNVTMEITMQPSHGTLRVHGDGTVSYLPDEGFVGQDVFAYRLIGPGGMRDQTTVEVLVVAPGTSPQPSLFIPMITIQ